MIRHIKGTVTSAEPGFVVIDVHGVGYLIFTTAKTGISVDSETKLYTHHAVRETASDLYGFTTQEELSFFELLLTLPKIGPKSALQILSQADVTLLQSAILSQDASHLSKMSGISKKTAEKIILGLKDAFDTIGYSYGDTLSPQTQDQSTFASDTIDALIALGYPQVDARKAVQLLMTEKPEVTKVNDAIKEVLKILA